MAQNPSFDTGVDASLGSWSRPSRPVLSGDGSQLFFSHFPDDALDRIVLTAPGTGYDDQVRSRLETADPSTHADDIQSIAIDDPADGEPSKLAYSGGSSGSNGVIVLDLASGRTQRHVVGAHDQVHSLEFSRDGSRLFVLSYEPRALGVGVEMRLHALCLEDHCGPRLQLIDQAPQLLVGDPSLGLVSPGHRWATDDGECIVYRKLVDGVGQLWMAKAHVSHATRPATVEWEVWSPTTSPRDVWGVAIDGIGSSIVFIADAIEDPGSSGVPCEPTPTTPAIYHYDLTEKFPANACRLLARPAFTSTDSGVVNDLAISGDGRHVFWSSLLEFGDASGTPVLPAFDLFTIPIDGDLADVRELTRATPENLWSSRHPYPTWNGDGLAFAQFNSLAASTARLRLVNRLNLSEGPDGLDLGTDPDTPFEIRSMDCGPDDCVGTVFTSTINHRFMPAQTVLTWNGWSSETGTRLFPSCWTVQEFADGIESSFRLRVDRDHDLELSETLTHYLLRVVGTGEQLDVVEATHELR